MWSAPPIVKPAPKLELRKSLTAEAVYWACYRCTPCGEAVIAADLRGWGYDFDDDELHRYIIGTSGLRGILVDLPGVREQVPMLVLKGQRV